MNNELNKKLAKWAGFFYGWSDNPETMRNEGGWYYPLSNPKTCMAVELPDFTESLDACFEWLVPNPIIKTLVLCYHFRWNDRIVGLEQCGYEVNIMWDKMSNTVQGEAETPALALCLAIEKLIEEKDEKGILNKAN